MLISAVLIFRNNAENNEINEETSVVVPSTSVAPTQADSTPSGTTTSGKTYTLTDVAKHDNQSDCWLVIDNNVYNVTSFIGQHPGGDEILKECGRDATSLFSRVRDHAENSASSLLPPYLIGTLK